MIATRLLSNGMMNIMNNNHISNMSSTASDVNDWTRSDNYHNSFLIPPDAALDSALKLSEQNGLPPFAVSAAQGKFLYLIAKSIQAHRILEVGTLGGYERQLIRLYSTISSFT